MAEKMRVHILAKELSVASKAILAKCAAEGLPVKNHMTALGPGLEATIREWFSDGQHVTTIETADRVDLKKVRLPRRKKTAAPAAEAETAAVAEKQPGEVEDGMAAPTEEAVTAVAEAPPAEVPAEEAPAPAPPEEVVEPAAEVPIAETVAPVVEPPAETEAPSEPVVEAPVEETPPPAIDVPEEPAAPEPVSLPEETEADERMVAQVEEPADTVLTAEADVGEEPPPPPETVRPAGPQNVPAPAKVKGPRVVRYEAPDRDYFPPPRSPRRRSSTSTPAQGAPPQGPMPPMTPETPGRRRGGDARRGRGKGAAAAQTPRRATLRTGSDAVARERLKEWRDRDLIERRERLEGATGRKIHRRRAQEAAGASGKAAPSVRKTHAQVHEPIQMKEFCSEVGVPFMQVMRKLQREHNMMVSINSTLPNEIAELVALEEGIELEIVKAKSRLDLLVEEFEQRKPKKVGIRPPVVTLLGHVDHGKTSLLDSIRRSGVAKGEDGGITQHIGAYHFKQGDVAVTFLDTPGHEAFTAMRARGAQLTDVVVLIVAADDGVMPQTLEAINHAKAAQVPIVVAITKTDLGVLDEARLYGQLAEQGLTPSGDWGGETDVIKTSAVTGEGIDELLEHLSALAELHEFEADSAGDPVGTVIEAETKEGVGSVVRVLVQQGKLRPGMTVVCGNAYGKVRALLDDKGKRLKEAGPSIPCEVWGLDEVPSAGDRMYCLKSPQQAKAIAEEIRQERRGQAQRQTQKARSLEDVFKQRDAGEIPELNVIIRADVDGSVDALRHALGQLPKDQVTLVIRHAGVGAVTDGDVLLADASDAIVIAFRVAPSSTTRKLAEEHGVDVREYKVIYNVIEDVVKALEGLLAPEEKREQRATVEVREVFRISKVGAVAGCYVTDGIVARDHTLRLVREGVVMREDCEIASLKRFKDDAKEVRMGMECGIRLEGFDDIKQGDVLEAYEIVKIARSL